MGIIADLVVSVRADTTQFQKDLKTKLGAASKGATSKVGGLGGAGAMAGLIGGPMSAVVSKGIEMLVGIAKKTYKVITQESRAFGMLSNWFTGTLGTFTTIMALGILQILTALKPVMQPLFDMATAFIAEFKPFWNGLSETFSKDIVPGMTSLNESLTSIKETSSEYVSGLGSLISGYLVTLGESIKTTMEPIVTGMVAQATMWTDVINKLDSVGLGIGSNLDLLGTSITGSAFAQASRVTTAFVKGDNLLNALFNKNSDIEKHTKISAEEAMAANELLYKSAFGAEVRKFRDKDAETIKARAARLEAAGFSWSEIVKDLKEWIARMGGERKAARTGLESDGTGGLVIPQDYWGNAYDGVGTGSWM